MVHQTRTRHRFLEPRPGVATLELVMCMPVLLILMIGIVWLGFSVVGQSEVAVQARHEAWQQRFTEGSAQPLNFLGDDITTKEATTSVEVSPLLDDVAPPESKHDVAVGTWDHQGVDLNRAPSWSHYLTAALNAATGDVQVAYTDARNQLGQLQGQASQILARAIQESIREMLESPLQQLSGLGNLSASNNEDFSDNEVREKEEQIRQRQAAIQETQEKIRQLQQQSREAEAGEEKESLQARIRLHRNKLTRLRTELDRLEEDRKAMD